uniref:Ring finger protein 11a n=1 Tax=Eptatretus burgeri TaxID=7764 RepID=A0A8C4WUP0_EPTBU
AASLPVASPRRSKNKKGEPCTLLVNHRRLQTYFFLKPCHSDHGYHKFGVKIDVHFAILRVPDQASKTRPPSIYSFQEDTGVPVYHPTPTQSRLATQLTEEEQVRIAQRLGLIQHLPRGVYDPGKDGGEKRNRECVICMLEFTCGDAVRFLPCLHTYHQECIDDWLMRSFTCPSCMEPVDAALLSSYQTG